MIDAEDLPGGLKARQVLKQMELNPPAKKRSRDSQTVQWIGGLYAELRAVREKGWSWKSIHAELSKIKEFPKMSPSWLSRTFEEIDREWSKKTGILPLTVRKNKKRLTTERKAA